MHKASSNVFGLEEEEEEEDEEGVHQDEGGDDGDDPDGDGPDAEPRIDGGFDAQPQGGNDEEDFEAATYKSIRILRT